MAPHNTKQDTNAVNSAAKGSNSEYQNQRTQAPDVKAVESQQDEMLSQQEPQKGKPKSSSTQSMSSLLAMALEVPNPSASDANESKTSPPGPLVLEISTTSSTDTLPLPTFSSEDPSDDSFFHQPMHSPSAVAPLEDGLLPLHSDFTVPTSNAAKMFPPSHIMHSQGVLSGPPLAISSHTPPVNARHHPRSSLSQDSKDDAANRRNVFGSSVKKRYRLPTTPKTPASSILSPPQGQLDTSSSELESAPTPPTVSYMVSKLPMSAISPLTPAITRGSKEGVATAAVNTPNTTTGLSMTSPDVQYTATTSGNPYSNYQSTYRNSTMTTMTPITSKSLSDRDDDDDEDDAAGFTDPGTTFHETIHAQSLLLGLAFMAVWSPNNAMAPNLTQMAESFGMTEAERDLYLGSYCALALGVFSLPISALLGFMADFYSRKWLFVACVVGGSLSSAWTGWSQSFVSLFLARLVNGGLMSASVPVAFSLLGDLFATEERNAASSGLTAMMGLGIILGQVYAGMVGPSAGWEVPFFVSALISLVTALCVLIWVREPDRGAKEKALQEMLESGQKYDRQLTLSGFWHAMRHNRSNLILLWQGFFTSLPWGIVFVFLNDYLSQEKGFSVPDATFMVMLFGVGTAIGGISGGYIGQVCQDYNRSYLPLFMAASTFLGILPFLGLLNSNFPNKHGYKAMGYSILAGCVASLPSVNARPCLINVNVPETRGAALTANNLLITLGRGIGPSCITLMGSLFDVSRQSSFNITLTLFWTITSIQLLFLAQTLPHDEDVMEAELAAYAAKCKQEEEEESGVMGDGAIANKATLDRDESVQSLLSDTNGPHSSSIETVLLTPNSHRHTHYGSGVLSSPGQPHHHPLPEDDSMVVSIEEYMMSFDGRAARSSIEFVRQGFQEIQTELLSTVCTPMCGVNRDDAVSPTSLNMPSSNLFEDEEVWLQQLQKQQELEEQEYKNDMEEILSEDELRKRQDIWIKRKQQQQKHNEQLDRVSRKDGDDGNDDAGNEETPLLV